MSKRNCKAYRRPPTVYKKVGALVGGSSPRQVRRRLPPCSLNRRKFASDRASKTFRTQFKSGDFSILAKRNKPYTGGGQPTSPSTTQNVKLLTVSLRVIQSAQLVSTLTSVWKFLTPLTV